MKILFVCTGNICRSPLAEGILRKKLEEKNIPAEVDSAGFEQFHVGDRPDSRAISVAKRHNVEVTGHRARLFTTGDFRDFDLIFIMDDSHYSNIKRFTRDKNDMEKVDYILNVLHPGLNLNVEDPWYGDIDGFETVFQKLDKACEILAEKIASRK